MERRSFGRAAGIAIACSACGSTSDATIVEPPTAPMAEPSGTDRAVRRAAALDPVEALDGRVDGLATGAFGHVTAATSEIHLPAEWRAAPGAASATSERGSVIQVASLEDDASLDRALASLSIGACSFTPPREVAVGAEKRPCTAQAGACSQGGEPIDAVVLHDAPGKLIVVGAYRTAEDRDAILGSMRSLTRLGAEPLRACCQALLAASESAPPATAGQLKGAAALCNAAPKELTLLRSLMASTGTALPAACR